MKQLKNFLIKREQSQACLSFAKREKSRLLAKTLLTLVALLAVTTGAWAAGSDALAGVFTINASGDKVQFSKGNLQAVCTSADNNPSYPETFTWQFAENQWDYIGADNNKVNGNGSVSSNCTIDVFGWSTSSNNFGIHNSKTDGDYSGDFVDWGTAIGSGWRTLTHDEWNFLLQSRTTTSGLLFAKANLFGTVHGLILFPDNYTHPDGLAAITAPNDATGNAGWNGNQYTAEEWAKMEAAGAVFLPAAGCREGTTNHNFNVIGYYHTATPADANNSYDVAFHASVLEFDWNQPNHWAFSVRLVRKAVIPTPVPLTWDAATKTATIDKMPAGNVTVSVEYYPQAEFAMSTDATPVALAPTAIPNVPANTDAPIVTPGTVANIGTSEVKQGTLMYFVKQADGNTEPVAPTYTTEGWTDKVPTADGLAQGDAYVWYYIKGAEPANIADRTDDNTRSDSDIKPLGTDGIVTLEAEPTYDVTFADGVNPEPPAEPEWTATPNTGVKKGTEVTVTYTGAKKVLGVKAEKKEAFKMAATATAEDVGKLICTDGHIHAYGEDAECTKDRVAMIAYVGNASDCSHGLAIALKDESDKMNWETAGTTCSGKTPTVTDGTWRLPSIMDWQYMLIGCGHNGTANANIPNDSYMVATGLFAKLSAAGGDEFIYWIDGVRDANYWMSTENSGNTNQAWRMHFNSKDEAGFHNTTGKNENTINVRACLAF